MLEKDIKVKVISKFSRKTADVYTELPAGNTRADVAILSDRKFVGFEIKSAKDNFKRFKANQRQSYLYSFDECWLIVDPGHVQEALALLSDNKPFVREQDAWGVMDTSFKVHLKPTPNKHNSCRYLLNYLWKADLVAEAKKLGIPKTYRKTGNELRREIGRMISKQEARRLVRKYLKIHKGLQ